tara:strand:+ start:5336 stop:5950 length:615 start_codon:yes stop_codon:yes gene_type:complete
MDPRQNPYEQKSQMLPPPVPSAKSMNSIQPQQPQQPQDSEEWFLFYSPRSPPCMNFIAEAKKLESVRSKINLINFDDDPHSLLKDNPWLSQHGVPCLAKNGSLLSGRALFDWLDKCKRGETVVTKNNQNDNSSEPEFSHLGEEAFTGFSQLNDGVSNEISTNMYSSIGAKQGSEGMDHENYSETGNTSSGLTLDNIEAERRKLN